MRREVRERQAKQQGNSSAPYLLLRGTPETGKSCGLSHRLLLALLYRNSRSSSPASPFTSISSGIGPSKIITRPRVDMELHDMASFLLVPPLAAKLLAATNMMPPDELQRQPQVRAFQDPLMQVT